MPRKHSESPVLKVVAEEKDGIDRENQPVRIGVPFPQGYLHPEDNLKGICGDGNVLPTQTRSTSLWSDGSVKWLLLDLFITIQANSQVIVALNKAESASESELPPLKIQENEREIKISNGLVSYGINRNNDIFFSSIVSGNTRFLERDGWEVKLVDKTGRQLNYEIFSCSVEEAALLRATIGCKGRFYADKGKTHINFTVRHTVFAGKCLIETDFIVHNPQAARHAGGLWDLGDPGSFFFKELSISCTFANMPVNIEWQAEKKTAPVKSEETEWLLYQDSSGGENWNSINHVDCRGSLTTKFNGYRAAINQGKLNEPDIVGRRATAWVRMQARENWIGGTILHFWQNFPKSLKVKNNQLTFGLFPAESDQIYELQGGEQKRHTLFFEFGLEGDSATLSSVQYMPHIHIDPAWVAYSGVIPYLVTEKDDYSEYLSYVKICIEGPDSFFAKREMIDEYGWRNYGDIYADHEAVNHKGNDPFISHYNNQYDFINGGLVHFLRSGDNRWFELAADAARHMIDIDIYHTDQDRSAYNGGLFWHSDHYLPACTATHRAYSIKNKKESSYGGGTSNEHIYSTGLSLYYYLTGDSLAKEAVLELAEYVCNMDDGKKSIFALFDEGPTGLASQTVDPAFHKPGRGSGNCINCLIDAWRLSNRRKYLNKAEELIQRCVHPEDDISLLRLDDPEYRWSYLVFLQILGRYLDNKSELGENDYEFFYARDSLLHYADWMAEHEVPYQDVLHKVLIPTETWPAHDIRKCHVFHLAAKYGPPGKQTHYKQKASYFYERCLKDLLSYKTAFLARPLIILCVYGFIHAYFLRHGHGDVFAPHRYYFGAPQDFFPQRQRFKKHFMKKLKSTLRLANLLLRNKIQR